jgi:uncharacterized small protein (DUF1192 family)
MKRTAKNLGASMRTDIMRDEDDVRRLIQHQIGEKLDDLSVGELESRIVLLREEIARLEAAKTQKQSAAAAATSFFKT